MSAKISFGREPFPSRVLACLLSAALAVSLCPLQGWSDETAPGSAPDQLMKAVPLSDEPEAPQLTKAVPLGEESETPQLTKAVPLAAEPDSPEPASSEAPAQDGAAKTVKVTFVVSDEPTASWPYPENVDAPEGADPSTADRVVEVPAGESLGALVPPTPVSSDDSLVFEGWQTEDYSQTYSLDELAESSFIDDVMLFAVFSSKTSEEGRAGDMDKAGGGTCGTCAWEVWTGYMAGTLYIKAGTLGDVNNAGWRRWASSITKVVIYSGVNAGSSLNSMFLGFSSLRSIESLTNLNAANTTDMSHMFYGCSSLSSLSLSGFNTSNATNMQYMFANCTSLSSLNLSGMVTSKVKSMTAMFSGCSGLTSLALSGFDTSQVESMNTMFSGCLNLATLSVSNFVTSNVANMTLMFQDCIKLSSLDISNFNIGKVEATDGMFRGCTSLATLNLPNKTTSHVKRMNSMFEACSSLKTLELGNFSFSNATDMSRMFYGCNALVEIPSAFEFGSASGEGIKNVFTATSEGPIVTTYNGSDENVKNYDWPSDNRALKGIPLNGVLAINGDMIVGQELTVSVEFATTCKNASPIFKWYRSSSATGTNPTHIGTGTAYSTTAEDVGSYILCQASDGLEAYEGVLSATGSKPVAVLFTASVTISGTTVVGQTLSAVVSDPNASTYSYQWQRADKDTANWADIPDAVRSTYVLAQEDFGKIIRCVVAPAAAGYTGTVPSDPTTTVQGELAGKVSVSGNLYANQELTASTEGLSGGATAAYKWYTATDAAGTGKTQIAGVTAVKLDLSQIAQTQVVGKYVLCEVYDSSNAYVNTLTSSAVGPIGIAWGTSGPKAGGCVWTIDAAGAMTIAPAANGQGFLGELKASSAPWNTFVAQVKSASIAPGVKSGASLSSMFSACRQMTSVDLSGLDASGATDLSSMFSACSSLATVKGLDVLNSAKPSNLGSMFYGCSKLTTLDLSGLAAGTATDLSAMFWGCSKLSDLKLPVGFVGEKCTTVVNMFYGCNALATIPPEFGFGSNKSIQTTGCFTATGVDPLATTYLGDDLNVATYDWQGSNRSLVSWKLSGEATITGGDDPIADNKLTASVTFTGPAAGLEEGAAYQWYTANSADDANPVAIDGATGATCSPRKADVGKFLVCLVSAPTDSGARGTLRAATTKAVRAPQVWATVPSRTQVYVDSQGHASVPTTSAYALGALDSEGKATEGDIQLVSVTLTLGNSSFPGGSWTLGTPGDGEAKPSTFIENKAFARPGTECNVPDAPAIAPGSKLPLEWEASFKNDIGPKLTSLLTAADGEGAHYGEVEFKVAWKPRA